MGSGIIPVLGSVGKSGKEGKTVFAKPPITFVTKRCQGAAGQTIQEAKPM